ncbi:hypothetical protein EJ08DRAFT_659901 [Tothia fuscella]|uniref:Uncharacterized protein n=1 Tax=Tothia fuscella TaxID=1048955 RepID=A0A9P4NTX7_9PEZI|nr:hypothetical protein EJ08DRAFT_659901 [Tothia fuscella]
MATALPNGINVAKPLIALSFALPQSPQVRIQLQLTVLATSLLLFLTTTSPETPSSACALGSFVYAMPNRSNPMASPLSTSLYTQANTLDFATRLAKVLTRKVQKPVYVGNSMSFAGAGRGGDVEEEMEGFRMVVDVVMEEIRKAEEEEEDDEDTSEEDDSSEEDDDE